MAFCLSESCYAASDIECLAFTVYKEANAESSRGRRAVLDVLYNRMRIRGMGACAIMKQKSQFSWYKRGMKIKIQIEVLTEFFEVDKMPSILPSSAEYFHNKSVKPAWARKMKRVAVIGNHIFYASKGGR